MSVRQNGAYTEYGPSHTKSQVCTSFSQNNHSGFVRNHGTISKWNSIIEYGYNRRDNYNRYDRDCDCNSYRRDNYNRYDREDSRRDSFGSFLEKALPVAIGIGAALFGPQIAKFLGGIFGNLFGDHNATNNNPDAGRGTEGGRGADHNRRPEGNKDGADGADGNRRTEGNKDGTDDGNRRTEGGKEDATRPETKPQTVTSTPPARTADHTVIKGETIFTIIQNEIKKERPEITKEELLQLTEKTIAANKGLLESNNQKKPIYNQPPRTVGDYIEIGDILKLVLK